MSGERLRVALADDHPLVLVGIRRILEPDGGFEVVGETQNGADVIPMIGRVKPDVVLLDIRLPGMDGLGCLERIRTRYPKVKVVILSMASDPEQIQSAFERGACGYIVKTIDPADLASAIRQAVNRTAYHALGLPALDRDALAQAAGLTERELTIVKAVGRGLSNRAIGKELWVTEQTIKFHLTNIYRKLGVTNRTEAARWAFAKGFVEQTEADGLGQEDTTLKRQ